MKQPRIRFVFAWRDVWIGVYVSDLYIYVNILPMLGLVIRR